MTAIERTAYPRLKSSHYRKQELRHFSPSAEELQLLTHYDIRGDQMRLNFLLQLKIYQALHHFVDVESIPTAIVAKLRTGLQISSQVKPRYSHSQAKSRHRNIIRQYLNCSDDHTKRKALIEETATQSATIKNDPAEIIGSMILTVVE